MGVSWSEKPGDGLSKIVPSSCSPGAARETQHENGGPVARSSCNFSVPYHLHLLVVRSSYTLF